MVLIAASNTALQTLSDNEMRGRVMSLFSMMLVGMAPVGSLLAGWAADRVGAPVVAIGGGFCAIAGIAFAKRLPRLREAAKPILVARDRSGEQTERRVARPLTIRRELYLRGTDKITTESHFCGMASPD